MNARLRKLLEQRATAWSAVQDIQARRAAAGYEDTAEDGETYTRSLDDVERLGRQIEDEERSERLAAVMNAPADDVRSTNPRAGDGPGEDISDEYRAAFANYMRRGMTGLNGDEQRLLQEGFVKDAEGRAQAAGTGAAGGYTVPQEFRNKMVETLKAFGGILSIAEVLNTSTGAKLPWPTNNDTANEGGLLSENTAVTEQDMVFGQADLEAHMYTSKLVRVSYQLLQDSAFNLEAWLPVKLGERIGRASARHFGTGTGVDQPQGLVTGLTKIQTSAAVGKVGYDDLVDLEHSVDPAYRAAGRTGYVLNDQTIRDIRKIKDTTGRPLWVPTMAGGVPSTINGQPYTVDNSIAVAAPGAKSIVFGDIKAAYVARIVAGAQTLRLAERYAEYLQVGFLGYQRLDGIVQDTSAAAVLELKAA